MKAEIVTGAQGVPIGVATDAASVPEAVRAGAAPADIPPSVPVPHGVPVVADRGSDSDPLRGALADDGLPPVAAHRKGRRREPTADGRRVRRRGRRREVGRSFAWLHRDRRVITRYERRMDWYDGLVRLALAVMSLNRLVK